MKQFHGGEYTHTRKQVQTCSLVRNYVHLMASKVPEAFGETFMFNKVFLCTNNFEPYALYIDGEFSKYINNDRIG